MALFINGEGRDSFSMNGVLIDNLYVDSVLVWSSEVDPPVETNDYAMKVTPLEAIAFVETEITGLTIGNEYTLTTTTVDEHSNIYRTKINALPSDNSSMVAQLGWGSGTRSLLFTATAETMYIAIGDEDAGLSGEFFITVDNISLKIDGVEAVTNGTFEGNNTTGWYVQGTSASMSIYEYNVEPPVPGDNPYLETINIPVYDAGNPAHCLIPDDESWSSATLENTTYTNYYVREGDYSSAGRIEVTRSGSASSPITVSLYRPGDELHPASLPDNEQAKIGIMLTSSDYWIINKMSAIPHFGDWEQYGAICIHQFCSNIIINQLYSADSQATVVSVSGQCYNNTIQKCYFDTPASNYMSEDVATIMLQTEVTDEDCVDTKIILNEFHNFKPIKLHDNTTTVRPNYAGTIIDNNVCWYDGDAYCDYDGTPNQNGLYALCESDFVGMKCGGTDPSNLIIVSNNTVWGAKPTWGQNSEPELPNYTPLSNDAPMFLLCYYGTKYVTLYNNLAIEMPGGYRFSYDSADQPNGAEEIEAYDNIAVGCGKTTESSEGNSWSAVIYDGKNVNIHDNLIKDPQGRWGRFDWNHNPNTFDSNDIVNMDEDKYYGDNSTDVTGLYPVDTNFYIDTAAGNAKYPYSKTVHYLKYTTSPTTKVENNVLKAEQR